MVSPRDSELRFKPLSQGLGFHPFSEGLPYSDSTAQSNGPLPTKPLPPRPASLTKAARAASDAAKYSWLPVATPSGAPTGAEAAGKPTFAFPKAPPNYLQRAVQPPSKTGLQTGIRATTFLPTTQKNLNDLFGIRGPIASATVSDVRDTSELKTLQPKDAVYGFEYLVKRATAYVLDTLLNIGGCALVFSIVLWKQKISLEIFSQSSELALGLGFLLLFSWTLITAQEVLFGTTAAKKVFGLAIFGTPWAILVRSIFFIMSLSLGGVGVLWAIFHPERRAWHDMVADLQPEEVAIL